MFIILVKPNPVMFVYHFYNIFVVYVWVIYLRVICVRARFVRVRFALCGLFSNDMCAISMRHVCYLCQSTICVQIVCYLRYVYYLCDTLYNMRCLCRMCLFLVCSICSICMVFVCKMCIDLCVTCSYAFYVQHMCYVFASRA